MRGAAEFGIFHRLDRFQRRAGRVFDRLGNVHRAAHRAGRVDAGAAGFVRKADEMRISEAMLQLRHIRPLAVGEVEDGNRLDCVRRLGLVVGFQRGIVAGSCGDFRVQLGVDVNPGVRHLTGREHHDIDVGKHRVLVQDQVVEPDGAGVARRLDARHLALGEGHAFRLRAAVEILAVAGRAQIRVNHHRVDIGIGVLEIHRLLDARVAAEAGAIGQVFTGAIALAGALHERNRSHLATIGRTLDRLAFGRRFLGKFFQTRLVDDVGAFAVGEFSELVRVVERESRCLHDRADFLGRGAA